MFIGKNIKYLRIKNNMTLEDLSKELGYKSLSTVQKWEVGVAQPPLKKVGQMAELFKVDIDDLTNTDLQNPQERQLPVVVSDFEKKIIQQYRISDEMTQRMVLKILSIDT